MELSSWQDVFLQVVQGERSHRTHRVAAPADAKAAELLHGLPDLPASDLHGREVIFSTSKRVDDEAAHIRLDSACHALPRSSLHSPLYVHVVPTRRAVAGAETRAYFAVAGDEGSVGGGDEAEHLNGGACSRVKMFPHRPDIDGLRALAVGALVVNHLHRAWLPGGGLGIDVCFVISGFLSAGSLLCSREIDRGALVGFYSRRILQLAPCFFTTVLTISIVLSFIVEDSDLYPSAHLALVGWANNYFATSYPSAMLERNPYAHLWAAGVQIQFYVLGPVLITIANWRGSTRLSSLILLALFAGPSLAFNSTVADPRVAYYLFPSRMWQFMAGAMVLTWKSGADYIEVSSSCMRVATAVELVLLVCLFLVLVHGECSLKWSLATVLCTAGLIGLGVLRPTQHEIRSAFPQCSACMSSRALVYVGQLSLPLFLWHWPVILLFKESLGLETAPLRVAALLVTLQLSMFSHYVVDASVRICRPQCHKSVFLSATIIVLSLEGLLGLLHGPFVGSFERTAKEEQRHISENANQDSYERAFTDGGHKELPGNRTSSRKQHRVDE
ncbi:hypothetical protein AB1Y20_009045 [Prymnesium parvum]|uniref:Acyltransferase 3 domain-containing protein n=1 Tax=Prymnesium parvum TaxID=97485 RepID=A0AB34K120_PRYPA